MGFFTSFVKNNKTRPSLSYKMILEKTRGKKSSQFLKRITCDLFKRIFGNKSART